MSNLPLNDDELIGALRLDPHNSQPLYRQISQALARLLRERRFEANSALPSERLLATRLGVSRVTARKAIETLVAEGLIERRQGSGSYVAPRLEQTLARLTGFTEELSARGFVPRSRWLKRFVGVVQAEEIVGLNLPAGTRVARLERVRLADDVPMALEHSALPLTAVPKPELVGDSLYAYLRQRDCVPVRALQHIRAVNASAAQAELLKVRLNEALLFITRFGYLADGQPVEITHTWCRNDYYDFMVELYT